MDARPVIRPVFLSASEPISERSPEYWDSRTLLNVRDAGAVGRLPQGQRRKSCVASRTGLSEDAKPQALAMRNVGSERWGRPGGGAAPPPAAGAGRTDGRRHLPDPGARRRRHQRYLHGSGPGRGGSELTELRTLRSLRHDCRNLHGRHPGARHRHGAESGRYPEVLRGSRADGIPGHQPARPVAVVAFRALFRPRLRAGRAARRAGIRLRRDAQHVAAIVVPPRHPGLPRAQRRRSPVPHQPSSRSGRRCRSLRHRRSGGNRCSPHLFSRRRDRWRLLRRWRRLGQQPGARSPCRRRGQAACAGEPHRHPQRRHDLAGLFRRRRRCALAWAVGPSRPASSTC